MIAKKTSRKAIILLHGFAANRLLMKPLEKRFREGGFDPINWGYNSWFKPIDHHAHRLHQLIHDLDADATVDSIHFATHSMGCIVTRAALQKKMPVKCGRWIMLGPPNKGSHIANSVPRFIKSVLKPIDELQAKDDSYVNRLQIPQNVDIAIVQATMDYIVAGSLTEIDEEKDRLVVPGLHSQMLFREDVAKQSLHFLEHGRFEREPKEGSSVANET